MLNVVLYRSGLRYRGNPYGQYKHWDGVLTLSYVFEAGYAAPFTIKKVLPYK